MAEREFLQERLATLNSLLAGQNLLKGGSGLLQSKLQSGWQAEARLLQRILAEPGAIKETIAAWQTRTLAFAEKNPGREGWTDGQGNTWLAHSVLGLLDDLLTRLNAAQQPDDYESDDDVAA